MTTQSTTGELRAGKVSRAEFGTILRRKICIILDGVESSSNLGNIFRLADAMLVEKIWICGKPPVFGSRFYKASRGTDRWVSWEYVDGAAKLLAGLKSDGYSIVAMELCQSAKPLSQFPLREPLALVFGSESGGVSQQALDFCDAAVYLPMPGMGNSINVSNSVAIALYEATRALTVAGANSQKDSIRCR